MLIRQLTSLIVGLLCLLGGLGSASAQSAPFLDFKLPRNGNFCEKNCAIHIYGGRETTTNMTGMFALDGVATFAPDKFVPVWDWQYRDSGLAAAALSRRLVTVMGVVDIEGEVGIGQRFGRMDQTEVWSALFFRWTWFPWNDYLKTTIGTSTGLNYASGIADDERTRDGRGRGSKLLHFFSPEITFALPSNPDWELVGRVHHRSGGRILFGDIDLFNGVDGGAHFATVGVRYRF